MINANNNANTNPFLFMKSCLLRDFKLFPLVLLTTFFFFFFGFKEEVNSTAYYLRLAETCFFSILGYPVKLLFS